MESDDVRYALGARVERCWERLEDAADELVEVHGVSLERLIDRLRGMYPDPRAGTERSGPFVSGRSEDR